MSKSGAPGEIRTPGLLVRSQTLYPAELRAHFVSWCVTTAYSRFSFLFNRDFLSIRIERRKTPGLKTRATALVRPTAGCCSPPLQRRGFLRGHPPSSNSRCPYFRSRRSAVNLVKRLPEVSGSEGVAASAVSFTFFIAPRGKGSRVSCPASQ